jgi:hypothetical protein
MGVATRFGPQCGGDFLEADLIIDEITAHAGARWPSIRKSTPSSRSAAGLQVHRIDAGRPTISS